MVKSNIPLACALLLLSIQCKNNEAVSTIEETKKVEQNGPTSQDIRAHQQSLVTTAEVTLNKISELETNHGMPSWISYRQVDWFVSEMQYDERAYLAKNILMKSWIWILWKQASEQAENSTITRQNLSDVESLTSLPHTSIGKDLLTFSNNVGLKHFNEVSKTFEHWRLVLAVVLDAIQAPSPELHLKPLETDALDLLAKTTTTLSFHLLNGATSQARAAGHSVIEKDDIYKAFKELSQNFNLNPTESLVATIDPTNTQAMLLPVYQKLLNLKAKTIDTLSKANAPFRERLNMASSIPISQEAADRLWIDLESFFAAATNSARPMRPDNYVSSALPGMESNEALSLVSEAEVRNNVQHFFPHQLQANGDVHLKLAPHPRQISRTKRRLKPSEATLLSQDIKSVQDTGIQWLSLFDVFEKDSFFIEPLGLEYLSDVATMFLALKIEQLSHLAKMFNFDEINLEVIEQLQRNSLLLVPPKTSPPTSWTRAKVSKKYRLLNRYANRFFEDMTRRSGLPKRTEIQFKTTEKRGFEYQQHMGGGMAVGDINGDGLTDVYIAGVGKGRLYLNKSRNERIKFVDATAEWQLPEQLNDGHGVLFFDVDSDQDLDLFITRSEHPSMLFENTGDAFKDITLRSNITTTLGAHSCTLLDIDNDHDLDIFVGYVGSKESHLNKGTSSVPTINGRNGSPNQLWQNNNGVFSEVGKSIGLDDAGWTVGATTFDKDNDGDMDLYIANHFGPNQLFENNGDTTFKNITQQSKTGDRGSGSGTDVSDVNNDGLWDIYVSNIDMFARHSSIVFPSQSTSLASVDNAVLNAFYSYSGGKLYVSNKQDEFIDEERNRFEPIERGWAWSSVFFDYDNDGDDDLYVANGWIKGTYANNQRNQLYLNDNGSYFLASDYSPETFAGNSRSVVAVDFDGDGDKDLLVNQFKSPAKLLQNNRPKRNKWLGVRIKSDHKNTFGIGSRVVVQTGGRTITKRVSADKGYLGQSDPVIYFGLQRDNFANVEIVWPGNITQKVGQLVAGQIHEVSQTIQ